MAMRYGYFDSEITGVDSEGMPIFDRAETSELFRLLFAKLLSRSGMANTAMILSAAIFLEAAMQRFSVR